jgi:hypothetical protein
MTLYSRMNRFLRLVGDEFRKEGVFTSLAVDATVRRAKPRH